MKLALTFSSILLVVALHAQDLAGDMTLHRLLIPGEDWQLVADRQGFTDAPCTDAEGNFYYSDMRSEQGIFRVGPDGKGEPFVKLKGASGMKFGPDGRLYCCVGGQRQLIAVDPKTGATTVLATNVQPNDLVVSRKGHLYFTETGKKQVTFLNIKTGELRPADTGITAPNGITLSSDQGTLAVSEYRGVNVWTFRVETDGSLTAKAPYMTMRTAVDEAATGNRMRAPDYKTASGGDGMCSDTLGRYYVATALGVQVFDPTGRHCGVLPKPAEKAMTSVALSGPKLEYLYATCGDKIFRRKVQATGVVFDR
jgi:sugar lactone lactonase YvrE